MIILTNKAGLSSAQFIISLLVSISTVFGCGVIPGGQTSIRTFTASGPSSLPVIAVYTTNNVIPTLFPGIATSKEAVQALVQRFAMQTVIDVLEIEGRRALLPDFVISNILGQLQVNTTYEPLLCPKLLEPRTNQFEENYHGAITSNSLKLGISFQTSHISYFENDIVFKDNMVSSCINVGSTVTGICPKPAAGQMPCQMVATAIDPKHLTLSGTITTTNIIMANWSRSMWQNVVDRALRLLRSRPFSSHLYTVTVTVS
ncbi:hypothetical protein KIN20_030287 [Parelaphostrongylus tenuis]|uniref:Uncharacterized protein n=1 Tax=Parelaphostrongylus tenuis TaxID=148309 RepID=A0AAD5R3U5_PARTN|nr:hypothetical protein KIN20_030287 [Parelaphostrongylus tenuis]